MTSYPSISVVIPVRNEATKIKACIEGILQQTVPVQEIIVIDSGSTDGTLEILRSYSIVRIIEIAPAEFNHGETRNLGVREAMGEYVLLTVGDARAYDSFWIQHLLDVFDDPLVAGVCGQQVCPHERDKNPVDWFRPCSPPSRSKYFFPDGGFDALPPAEKLRACGWDDVTAMYRREVLLKIPFQRTSYSEDAIWAKDALRAGYAIVYNTAARVYHYHNENKEFTFKRTLTTMYMRYRHFGFVYPNQNGKTIRASASRLKTIFTAKQLTFAEKLNWLKYNRSQDQGVREAANVFHAALSSSEKKLDEVHERFCGKPPIPLKATKEKHAANC